MKKIALFAVALFAAVSPAYAIDFSTGWAAVHNRSPTASDDATRGYFEVGSVSAVSCGLIGNPTGSGLTAVSLTVAAPPGPSLLGEVGRTATVQAGINGAGSSNTAYVLDGGSGYNPASPPAVTVASFTGATTPSGCTAKVAQTASIWNELDASGKATGRVWSMASSTPKKARWVRILLTGLPVDAIGGTAPVFIGGTTRVVASYTGPLFSCLPPAGGSTTDIPQDTNGDASLPALQAYLTAASTPYCNMVKSYNQDGSGADSLAGFESVSATVGGTTSGYSASTTFVASASSANTNCAAGHRPTYTIATDGGGNAISAAILAPGSCTATSATLAVTLTGAGVGSGSGLIINANTWYQTGDAIYPVLHSGKLRIERIYDSGQTTLALKPVQAVFLPSSRSVPANNFTVLLGGYTYSSSQSGGIISLGAPGGTSLGLQVSYAMQSLGSTGFTNWTQFAPSLTPQTILWEQSPAGHEIWQGNADTYFPLANGISTAQAGGELLASVTALGTQRSYGGFSSIIIYGRALSLTERYAGISAVSRLHNTATQAVNTLVFVGHSRFEGARATDNDALPQKVARLIADPSLRVYNNGLYGGLASQFSAVISDNWAGHSANPRATFNAAIVMLEINDANTGRSSAQMISDYAAVVRILRSQGFSGVYGMTDYTFGSMTKSCVVLLVCSSTNNLAATNAAIMTGGIPGLTGAFDLVGTDQINFAPLFFPAASISGVQIAAGGSGYAVGNTVTVPGGTLQSGATIATYSVSGVTSGAITALTYVSGGPYTVPPADGTTALTGGAGSGGSIAMYSGSTLDSPLVDWVFNPQVTSDGGHSNDLGLDIAATAVATYIKGALAAGGIYPPR